MKLKVTAALCGAFLSSVFTAAPATASENFLDATVQGLPWGVSTFYNSAEEKSSTITIKASHKTIALQRATNGGRWMTVRAYTFAGARTSMTVELPTDRIPTAKPKPQYFRLMDGAKVLSKEQKLIVFKHPARPQGWTYSGDFPRRFNPCKPITYRVDASQAYGDAAAALAMVKDAAGELEKLAGVKFEYLGETSVNSSPIADLAPETNITLKFGYLNGQAGTTLRADRAFLLGSTSLIGSTRTKIVLDQKPSSWRNETFRRVALKHELAHALGLGHTSNAADIMGIRLGSTTNWSPQDLAGLKAVGMEGGCF